MSSEPVSSMRYMEQGGDECPVCQRTTLDKDSLEPLRNGTMWRAVRCRFCGAVWDEVYQLAGYGNLEINENYNQETDAL